MKSKDHKKKAVSALKKEDSISIDENDDFKSVIGKIVKMKAAETGAVAPDHIEYKFDLKHRGFLHSQFTLEKIEDYLEKNANNPDPIFQFLIKPFLIGYTSHLREDEKTKMGIPSFY